MCQARAIGKLWPESAGMLKSTINETIVLPYNDVEAVRDTIKRNKRDIAAIILEPIMHNCGCILPKNGYLETLRELTTENDILLIFDEVITGFRHDLGGVQKIFGINPDISTFAKSMANGYPIAAICGRADIMRRSKTSKDGDVFFAGTYNAHPISLAAAKATIGELEIPEIYRRLYRLGNMMRENLSKAAQEVEMIVQVKGFGSIFITYFTNIPITKYEDIPNRELDNIRIKYRREMFENGIFMIPFRLKRNYISSSHTEKDVKKTVEEARKIFQKLKNQS
ncbi:MAG: aspartate aminotransferase family protein [Promethearchaeota archaeon]